MTQAHGTHPATDVDARRSYPLVPLRNQVVLPGARAPIAVARTSTKALIAKLAVGDHVVLATQVDPTTEALPDARGLVATGVLARVLAVDTSGDGDHRLDVEGLARVELADVHAPDAVGADATARATAIHEGDGSEDAVPELRRRALAVLSGLAGEARAALETATSLGAVTDLVATAVPCSARARQALLAERDPRARAATVHGLLDAEERKMREMFEAATRLGPADAQLWPLEPGAEERIARDLAAGRVTAEEAADLRSFAELGYVVWERLVPEADVDALVADVRSIAEHPGSFLTTDHRRGHGFRYSGPDFDAYESVFDTYVHLASARRVCFHPKVVRFLRLVFDDDPLAFQQLLFQRSNGHPPHQDTSFVCVEQPRLLAATWIALEDVVEGRGELVYWERSHRIPPMVFADGSRRFTPGVDDPERAQQELLERCEAAGCTRRTFLAKKGDCFVWAADLVHASNARTRPAEETRLSCVTHYCPRGSNPAWFWLFPDTRGVATFEDGTHVASSHYRLPVERPFEPPVFDLPLPC
ncbi:MAG: LON peptidase substrate-binding domain-containing protein [Planctomycetota bacterium]